MLKNKNYSNLLKHNFWGNFDSGVISIFLSFHIWTQTSSMTTIAIVFMIPVLVNTIFDYYFSGMSDKGDRIKLMILGNIGSAIFLSLYGFSKNIYILYLCIFMKTIFTKLYNSSLEPFKREAIVEEDYKQYIADENSKISIGASLGGFLLMIIYGYYKDIAFIFIISGIIELYSTKYLFKLKNIKNDLSKEVEENIDIMWLNRIAFIYAFEALGISLVVNRMIIFLNDVHKVSIQRVGIIFFIVYGISSIVAGKIYDKLKKMTISRMFILSFVIQAILLTVFTVISKLTLIIVIWFIFEVISNITEIYSRDKINRSIFSNIGKRMGRFRITVAIGNI